MLAVGIMQLHKVFFQSIVYDSNPIYINLIEDVYSERLLALVSYIYIHVCVLVVSNFNVPREFCCLLTTLI